MPTKNKPSQATKRAPYQPVTRLEQVPIAFYEILQLATKGQSAEIVPLIKSVIAVTQQDADGLAKLPLSALLALEDNLVDWQAEIAEIEKLNDSNIQVFTNMWKQRLSESLSLVAACRQACPA